MEKENVDPELTGILRKTDAVGGNRRVLFAPEVTMHKIDFVRRAEAETSDMEVTEPISSIQGPLEQAHTPTFQDMDMEITVPISSIHRSAPQEGPELEDPAENLEGEGPEMEVTEAISKIEPVAEAPAEAVAETEPVPEEPVPEEPEMEVTEAISTIQPAQSTDSMTQLNPEEVMEVTQSVSSIQVDKGSLEEPDGMEVTQSVSAITTVQREHEEMPTTVARDDSQAVDDMEVTQSISSIRAAEPSETPVEVSETHEEASETPGASEAHEEALRPTELPEKTVTTPSDPVASAPSAHASPAAPPAPADARLSMSGASDSEAEFDIQIPIPSDLNRYSEDFKSPAKRSSEGPFPAAKRFGPGYKEYTNVSLNQFLSDINIKFFDDIETDDIENNQMEGAQQEDTLNDYIRVYNKMLWYSLYEQSNTNLSHSILETREYFEKLDQEVLKGNPAVIQEFYLSSGGEQSNMKSDYSLKREFSQFQAKNVWYDWRIKVTTNLVEKMRDRYEVLSEDREKLQANIAVLDEAYDSKLKELELLKLRMNFLENIKDNKEVLPNFKQAKQDLIKLNEELQAKLAALEAQSSELSSMADTIKSLNEEIKANNKFEANEIKLLNLNHEVLTRLTGLRIDNNQVLYKNFKVIINYEQNTFTVEVAKRLKNEWIADILSDITEKVLAAQPVLLAKLIMLRDVLDTLISLDREVFMLLIKIPVHSQLSSDALAFTGLMFKDNTYKVEASFSLPLQKLINKDLQFDFQYKVLKGSLTAAVVVEELRQQCHVRNAIVEGLPFSYAACIIVHQMSLANPLKSAD